MANGFSAVHMQGYMPQMGDVAVIQNNPGGDIAGQIGIYTGSQRVSDFKQRDI